MSSRWRIARAAGACALVLGAAACSGSSGDAARRLDIEIDAGGKYAVDLGTSLSLTGTAAARGQTQTRTDLEAIGAALRAYAVDHGSYPPAFLTDAAGRPTVSWRVLLLPYLDQQALYERFDLTKPWDDAVNRPLLAQMPVTYRGTRTAKSTATAYAGVAGPNQVFRGGAPELGGGVRPGDVIDGLTMTTAVGPTGSDTAIPWSAPRDLTIGASPHLGDATAFDGPGTGVTPMLFLDGTVIPLLDTTDTASVRSWSTIAAEACSPPNQYALRLAGAWDLDGDGVYETPGQTVSYRPASAGTRRVRFRVVDSFGGVHVESAEVTVR